MFSFIGVGIGILIINPRLTAWTTLILPPLFIATWLFRNASTKAYEQARERIAVVNANLQEGLSGVRVSQAFVREGRNVRRVIVEQDEDLIVWNLCRVSVDIQDDRVGSNRGHRAVTQDADFLFALSGFDEFAIAFWAALEMVAAVAEGYSISGGVATALRD